MIVFNFSTSTRLEGGNDIRVDDGACGGTQDPAETNKGIRVFAEGNKQISVYGQG